MPEKMFKHKQVHWEAMEGWGVLAEVEVLVGGGGWRQQRGSLMLMYAQP